jgi:hypothetical protein
MPRCCSRLSTSCASAFTRRASRHASPTIRNGGRISSRGCSRQIDATADAVLAELLRELSEYRSPHGASSRKPASEAEYAGVVVPLQLITEAGILSFFSTTTVFGTPVDITLSELALESFFPADASTADALRQLAAQKDKITTEAPRHRGKE